MSGASVADAAGALAVHPTAIPGLLIVDLPVHRDNRGWFKENWQREKMLAIGLPDFGPVQNNVSFNGDRGVTRWRQRGDEDAIDAAPVHVDDLEAQAVPLEMIADLRDARQPRQHETGECLKILIAAHVAPLKQPLRVMDAEHPVHEP